MNGKLTFSYLKLTNANNNNEVFEYEINALGNHKMALFYKRINTSNNIDV